MPITALPEETARILTSSVALNDAVTLIKELIENALDARATNIIIETSSNTVDVVQVKDNGFGIGVDDRQLLCQRGCTSKIRTMDDLASLGGTSLGFRGEALYSACNVSASVLVTTRVEGEVVGSSLKFGANGKMLNSSSASHPVGTTVRVQDFLSKIPVRKQAALKATSKTLHNIRKLLNAYVFARPEVRISFKVLKAKNDKSNWNYAPNAAGTTLMEAATKIVGVEVTSQLLLCHSDSKQSEVEVETQEYRLEALLIDPASDAQKACSSEQFIAVDNRPVSTEKDLMRDLLKTYKKFLRNALPPQNNTTYTKPFLSLRISCPPESYDINVEPAKDRVMFYKPSTVYEAFENMLTKIYGVNADSSGTPPASTYASKPAPASSFDLLLAQRSDKPMRPDSTSSPQGLKDHTEPADEGMDEALSSGEAHVERDCSPRDNMRDADNPWTKAKMNVRLHPQESSQHKHSSMRAEPTSLDREGQSSPDDPSSFMPQPLTTANAAQRSQALTPEVSSNHDVLFQNPGPPIPRRGPRDATNEISPPPTASREPTLLEEWIQAQSQPASHTPASDSDQLQDEARAVPGPSRALVTPSRTDKPATRLLNGGIRTTSVQQTLSSPFKRPSLSQFPSSPNQDHSKHSHPANPSRRPPHPSRIDHADRQESVQELDEILEFERQKKEVSRQRRKAMRAVRAAEITADLGSMTELRRNYADGQELEADVSSPQSRGRGGFERRFAGQPENNPDWTEEPQGRSAPPLLGAQRMRTIASRGTSGATRADMEDPDCLPQAGNVAHADAPSIRDADPRAYLVRQRKMQEDDAHASAAGMTRTGLKIRRVKSTRLPLETVPAGDELCHLATVFEPEVGSSSSGTSAVNFDLCVATNRLASQDEYVRSGSIDGVKWLPASQEIVTWEEKLIFMLQKTFGHAGEDVAYTDFSFHISKAIKAHVDEFGG